MKTTVVNIGTGDDYDVYVGRPGKGEHVGPFGNPFGKPGMAASRSEAIAKHKVWFHHRLTMDLTFLGQVLALRGKRLGCFCVPLPCHGETIAAFVNAVEEAAKRNAANPGPGLMPFSCSVCEPLQFTQITSRNKECPGCYRYHCPTHHPPSVHACPGREF